MSHPLFQKEVLNKIEGKQAQPGDSLMPMPHTIHEHDPGYMEISENLSVFVQGPADSITSGAVERFKVKIERIIGTKLTKRGGAGAIVLITYSEVLEWPSYEMDEGYELEVELEVNKRHSGKCAIKARTNMGVLRGMETFLQLLLVSNGGHIAKLPAISIKDSPRFLFRCILSSIFLSRL